MKKFFITLLFYYTFSSCAHAQDSNYIQRPSIGIHILLDQFRNYNNQPSTSSGTSQFGLALNYLHGLTPRIDINAMLAGAFRQTPAIGNTTSNKHLLLEGDASIKEKLFRGSHTVNPFLQAGLGLSNYNGHYGLFLPAGVGCQFTLPGETLLQLHMQYRSHLTGIPAGHFFFSLGIAGIVGKRKKFTPHPRHSKPLTQATAVSNPDSDGDGIPDSIDQCPTQAGPVSLDGCPDTDGDGIPDKTDRCPLVKGPARLQGCPEPDRDRDGVADSIDKCPDAPGFRENEGCPAVSRSIHKKIDQAAKNIFFETDKYTLLPSSFPALDEVASILVKDPSLKLEISGHTDNTGTPEKNQVLSSNRARAVLEYLSSNGRISEHRLSATGYGSTRPISGNDTPEGKALNRRVELRVTYF